jgi:hypothetical protein
MESARLEVEEVPELRRRSDGARRSPPDDAHKARALGADGGAEEVPELRRRGDGARRSPPDDARKARALGANGGAEGPDSSGLDDKTEAGAGAGDEARRREDGELVS